MAIPSKVFGSIINTLLWFLPEKKRRRWRRGLIFSASIILLSVLAFMGVQRIGPIAEGPVEDPIERLNRAGAALSPNAAHLYLEAIKARTKAPTTAWIGEARRCSQPLSAELVAWIEENTRSVDLTRQATEIRDCHFPLRRCRTTAVDIKPAKELRRQARFVALRARRAAAEHDLEALVDSLTMLTRMARHMSQHQGAIGVLQEMSGRALAMEHCLSPYTWPELSFGQRASYGATVRNIITPLPDLADVLDYERDDLCWLGTSVGLAGAHWCYPSKRWYGEIDRALRPYYDLAGQPVEAQLNPANPLWEEIADMQDRAAFAPSVVLNLPRQCATTIVSTMTQFIKLRARFVARQRGLRTVTVIMDYAQKTGRWPESLETLGGNNIIDPFTGAPFFYRRIQDSFILYSAGSDRDDDSGTHHERFGNRRGRLPQGPPPSPDGDYVLWPLPELDCDG